MKIGSYENIFKMVFQGTGKYDFPIVAPATIDDDEPLDFIGFNYALSCKHPENHSVHFFVDDYQFERVWKRPDDYLNLLKQFKNVCMTDFSLYTDFPRALKIYNNYRNHWLAAYWRLFGINVIPSVTWSDEESFDWVFDGMPQNSDIIVSTVGTQRGRESKRLFLLGYEEMMKRLTPRKVIFYGSIMLNLSGRRR